MRPIGGELECRRNDYNVYFTDSGRSSLRLFLRSFHHKKLKYLIPNFFCEVIEKIFQEEKIEYDFYNILDTLKVDTESIVSKEYDVLYLINYFGMIQSINIDLDSKIIIEDNVFFYDFKNSCRYKAWYGFNSFRKITPLADGSLIKTNLEIDKNLISSIESPFVKIKYEGKDIKYNYIYRNNQFLESDYLNKFIEAETLLNRQSSIHQMSFFSQERLLKYNNLQSIAKKRYEFLSKRFSNSFINIDPIYYSFFILFIENRDEFRKKLMKKNIFLAVHWCESSQKNSLYNSVISIPLFSHYSDEEFNYLVKNIEEVL